MKARELRGLGDEELRQKLSDTREEHFSVRMQKSMGQLEKPLRLRVLRRDIAKILTIMNERNIS